MHLLHSQITQARRFSSRHWPPSKLAPCSSKQVHAPGIGHVSRLDQEHRKGPGSAPPASPAQSHPAAPHQRATLTAPGRARGGYLVTSLAKRMPRTDRPLLVHQPAWKSARCHACRQPPSPAVCSQPLKCTGSCAERAVSGRPWGVCEQVLHAFAPPLQLDTLAASDHKALLRIAVQARLSVHSTMADGGHAAAM